MAINLSVEIATTVARLFHSFCFLQSIFSVFANVVCALKFLPRNCLQIVKVYLRLTAGSIIPTAASVPHRTTSCRIAPHHTTIHHTIPHCTVPHRSVLHHTALHCSTPHRNDLNLSVLHCTTRHHTALHHTTSHRTAM
jgi:hypothetical protein